MKFNNLGWIVAAGLFGLMMSSGFQGSNTKTGVVDISQLFQTSDLTRRSQEDLRLYATTRSDILQFIHTYRSLPEDKAKRFKELSLKSPPSAAERAELDKIRQDALAEDKQYKALQTKAAPSPDEIAKLQQFSQNAQALSAYEKILAREFDTEVTERRDTVRDDVLEKIRDSVREVAKRQGYSIVFVKDVVPYGANDLTAEALKTVNGKK